MKTYSYTIQGKRESNEDTHVIYTNLHGDEKYNNINLIGVFDGHGGKTVSKFLKDNILLYFTKKRVKEHFKHQADAIKYFYSVFENLQEKLCLNHPRASSYCGSTACIIIHYLDKCKKERLWVLNVGDSRVIKSNFYGIAEQLSNDHKPNEPTEKARIEKLGGKIEFDGIDWRINDLSLSRAFGDTYAKPYVSHMPHIYNYKIHPKDKFLIIACDGLWDVVSNQEANDFIMSLIYTNNSCNYAKELVEYAYNRGSLDNITVIVYIL